MKTDEEILEYANWVIKNVSHNNGSSFVPAIIILSEWIVNKMNNEKYNNLLQKIKDVRENLNLENAKAPTNFLTGAVNTLDAILKSENTKLIGEE